MLPPSFDIWQQRIVGRGVMAPEVYKSRLETALRIFEAAQTDTVLHFVVNDDVPAAAQQIDDLANGRPVNDQTEHNARAVLEELLARTQQKLADI
jgi:guanylate kinase